MANSPDHDPARNSPSTARRFLSHLTSRRIVRRGLIVSLFVGTILIAINQGDAIIAGNAPPIWKIGLTFLVPYCVSTISAAVAAVDRQG